MKDVLDFDCRDVLKRAYEILSAGPLEDGCSEYCPWCAIAEAKGQLDREHDSELSLAELGMYWTMEVPSDAPLIKAREALSSWKNLQGEALTQEEALFVLQEGLKRCEEVER